MARLNLVSNARIYFTKLLIIIWTISNIAWAADVPDVDDSEGQHVFSDLAQLDVIENQHPPVPQKTSCCLLVGSLGAIFQDGAVLVGDLSAYSQRTLTALVTLGGLSKEVREKLLVGITVTQAINTFCEQIRYSSLESSIQTQKVLQTTYQAKKMAKEYQRRLVISALPVPTGTLGSARGKLMRQTAKNILTPSSAELTKFDQDIQNLANVTGCEANYKSLKVSFWQNSHYYLRFFELILNLTHVVIVCSNLFDYSSSETAKILMYTLLVNEIAQFFTNKLKNYGHTVDFETNKYRKPLPDISDDAQDTSILPANEQDEEADGNIV